MISSPVWFVTPTGYQLADKSEPFVGSPDPIGDCMTQGCDGDSFQLTPGAFPPIKKPFDGMKARHLCGWRDGSNVLQSSLLPDLAVGSTDNFLLGPGTSGFLLEDLLLPLDDRAGVKTTSGVGPQHSLIGCMMFGPGSPHDPAWNANTKWGVHTYDTAGWSEIRTWKWSIFGEHGNYHHNIQGNHAYSGGGGGNCGGCDIFIANRQNEGAVGKGNVTIADRTSEDFCVGQGGSSFTFRGGMPNSIITLNTVRARLGCATSLAAPFNQNICGVLSVDSADETAPGKGDAAWPGGTAAVHVLNCDWEVGTVYQGRTGMIRPVAQVSAAGLFTVRDTRIKVTRAPGAYPIAIAIGDAVGSFQIGAECEIDGWIDFHGTRYTTLPLFLTAHPECAA